MSNREPGIIQVTVIDREGQEHPIEIPTDMGLNMMEVCKASELPVEGLCGGMALCATCQVYVESDHELPPPTDDELAMLDAALHVRDNSRLGCQLKVTEALDGLIVRLAPN